MESNALIYHLTKVFSELEARIVESLRSTLIEQGFVLAGTPIGQEKLLTDKQICEHLQISISHFFDFKKAHPNFPTYPVGKNMRYKISEVEEFLKSNSKNPKK